MEIATLALPRARARTRMHAASDSTPGAGHRDATSATGDAR